MTARSLVHQEHQAEVTRFGAPTSPALARCVRGRWSSEGQRRLHAVKDRHFRTMAKLAEFLGVSERHVGRWLRGEERPTLDACVALWLKLGLPVVAWVLAPNALMVDPDTMGPVHSPPAAPSSSATKEK